MHQFMLYDSTSIWLKKLSADSTVHFNVDSTVRFNIYSAK